MAGMAYLKVYHDLSDTLALMDDAAAGRLFKAVLAYSKTREMPAIDGAELLVFSMLRGQIDRDADAYDEKAMRGRENGARGGRPAKTESVISEPEKTQSVFQEPEKTQSVILKPEKTQDKDKDKDKEEDKDKDYKEPKESKPEKSRRAAAPARPSLEEVRAYCRERGNDVDPEAWYDHYTANGWKIGGKSPMRDWQACVRNWERNGFGNGNGNGNGSQARAAPTNPALIYQRGGIDMDALDRLGKDFWMDDEEAAT